MPRASKWYGERMGRLDYEIVRGLRPELRLPAWRELWERDKERLASMDTDQLIANRVYQILRRDPGVFDYGMSCDR